MEKILDKYKDEIERDFGIDVKDLGVHSFRKGAAGYISSGSTCAPPQVATNLRAGWTMGVIQDTYLKYEAAGDQYVGRVVSGLPVCSAKFAILPPQLDDDCDVETTDALVKSFFPGIPSHFHYCCKFFAASLLYHFEELKTIISPSHPLLIASFVTSSHVGQLRNKVSVSYAWEEASVKIDVIRGDQEHSQEQQGLLSSSSGTESSGNGSLGSDDQTMPKGITRRIQKATGIPAHVMLMAEMQRVVHSQQQVLYKLKEVISTELDKRQVGHSAFQVQSHVEDILKSFERRVILKFDELKSSGGAGGAVVEAAGAGKKVCTAPGGGHWYHWGGQYTRVPYDYNFPNKMTLKNAWLRYFLPDRMNNICPMRYFTGTDLQNIKTGRRNLSAYKMLVQFMISEAKKKSTLIIQLKMKLTRSIVKWQAVFYL